MPRTTIKLTKDDQSWYLLWSTVVDAPVTYGMDWEEYMDFIRQEEGQEGINRLLSRKGRLEEVGVTGLGWKDVADVVTINRAGPDETELSLDEIIQKYCIDRPMED